MPDIPQSVREYLSSGDALFRAEVAQRHPDLQHALAAPTTRAAILDWLSSETAWDAGSTGLTVACLEFLRAAASEAETPILRPFVLHPDPLVRIRAYEFLLTLYFPDKNPEATLLLFQNMLSDESDAVRTLAARYVDGMTVGPPLRALLDRWLKAASERGWRKTESYELIARLLGQ